MGIIKFVINIGILYLAYIGGKEVYERAVDSAAERAFECMKESE